MKRTKIAVTGGPSGGKTTLIDAIKKELGPEVAVVPEAASILYKGGFPRGKTPKSLVFTQRAIYYTQSELEELILDQSLTPLIVCDRGSLDSLAYWPYEAEDFFSSLRTNKGKELERYEWVLHLDTAASGFYDTSNPIRTESYDEAWALNQKIKLAWEGHPQRIIISQNDDFFGKMARCIAIVSAIIAGESYNQVTKKYS